MYCISRNRHKNKLQYRHVPWQHLPTYHVVIAAEGHESNNGSQYRCTTVYCCHYISLSLHWSVWKQRAESYCSWKQTHSPKTHPTLPLIGWLRSSLLTSPHRPLRPVSSADRPPACLLRLTSPETLWLQCVYRQGNYSLTISSTRSAVGCLLFINQRRETHTTSAH